MSSRYVPVGISGGLRGAATVEAVRSCQSDEVGGLAV
jgi:hypothetical protein